ncbi:MAG: hypothetical protein IPM76_27810 [Chloroflexi bacterium]|nr:hypothetical protein [Chloroflexota bacterium]
MDQTKPDMPPEELTRVLHQLGRNTPRMHALHGARFGYDCPDLSAGTWRAAFAHDGRAAGRWRGLGVLLPVLIRQMRQRPWMN